MKKTGLFLAVVMLAASLAGCGNTLDVDETTLVVNEDLTITQAIVEEFDEEVYDSGDLETYINNAVDESVAKYGEEAVVLDSYKIKDGTAKVQMTFDNWETYMSFEGMEFFAGSVSEAVLAGYDFDDYFTSVTDGAAATTEASGDTASADATHNVLANVVVVSESLTVQVPGTITYISAQGAEVVSSDTVRVDMDAAAGSIVYILYE